MAPPTKHLGCTEEGCERDHHARGLCLKHYQLWRAAEGLIKPRHQHRVRAHVSKHVDAAYRPWPSGPGSGYLAGSRRLVSLHGIWTLQGLTPLHTYECSWNDKTRMRTIDVWHHEEVGSYAINPRTLARSPVKYCKQCIKEQTWN